MCLFKSTKLTIKPKISSGGASVRDGGGACPLPLLKLNALPFFQKCGLCPHGKHLKIKNSSIFHANEGGYLWFYPFLRSTSSCTQSLCPLLIFWRLLKISLVILAFVSLW